MPKNPLFSTYRQGENRVTSSMLAVFERIDAGVVVELLAAVSGDEDLAFVEFKSQLTGKSGSVEGFENSIPLRDQGLEGFENSIPPRDQGLFERLARPVMAGESA